MVDGDEVGWGVGEGGWGSGSLPPFAVNLTSVVHETFYLELCVFLSFLSKCICSSRKKQKVAGGRRFNNQKFTGRDR